MTVVAKRRVGSNSRGELDYSMGLYNRWYCMYLTSASKFNVVFQNGARIPGNRLKI